MGSEMCIRDRAKIINSSVDLCKYPASWKRGQVTPLFKKDDELNKANYRPVLPALNNVFERILAAQLNDFYCCTRSTLSRHGRVLSVECLREAFWDLFFLIYL